jgi:hypothetical protein
MRSRAVVARWWWSFWPASSRQRLEDLLPTYQRDLAFMVQIEGKSGPPPAWAAEADALLEGAKRAAREYDTEKGWRHFFAAQRLELYGLREAGPEAFRTRADSLRAEGLQKLRSWRRKRVEDLFGALPAPEKPDTPVSDAEFAVARETALLLHEHFSNEALKQRATKSQTWMLVAIAVSALVIWLRVAGPGVLVTGTAVTHWGDPRLLASVLLFGLMGAAFSALISLASQSAAQTIPEQVFTYRITLARQAVGLLSALAVYVLVASEFLQIGKLPVTPALVLLAAFGAGFSERLVVRALERLTASGDGAKSPVPQGK